MITHVLCYKASGVSSYTAKLFHSLHNAEVYAINHQRYYDSWILHEIKYFNAETGEASYNTLKCWEREE